MTPADTSFVNVGTFFGNTKALFACLIQDFPMLDQMLEQLQKKGLSDNDISIILSWMAFRLYNNPDETSEEALQAYLHDCPTAGHIFVPDWDKDIQWNEHFILIPQKCKMCGLKSFEVLEKTTLDSWASGVPRG